MSEDNPNISEDELHAYVDDLLEPARRQAVEQYLVDNPTQAERVRAYQQYNVALKSAFDTQLNETVPERFEQHLQTFRHPLWQRPWFAAAASITLLLVGGMFGWMLHSQQFEFESVATVLVRPAHIAHVVYTPEIVHPVEVGAEQDQHLFKWLSNRLGEKVRAPDLASVGFQLIGGRLLPGEQSPAAQFMYENVSGSRLTLYVRSGFVENQETAFRFQEADGVSTFYWIDRPMGYALSGGLARDELLNVANVVYRELNP